MKQKTKGIVSVIGGTLLLFLLGSYHTWARISDYFLSHLHWEGSLLTHKDFVGLTSFIRLFYTGFLPLGAFLTTKFGIISPCIFSIIISLIAHLMLLFFKASWSISMAFFLFCIGIGVGYLPPLMNAWRYYPDNKAMVTAIILTGFASSSFVLEFVAGRVINASSLTIPSPGYYPKEMTDKFSDYVLIVIGLFIVFGIASILMIKPYYESEFDKKPKVYGKLYEEAKEEARISIPVLDVDQEERLSLALTSIPFYQLTSLFLLATRKPHIITTAIVFGSLHLSTSQIFGSLNDHHPSFIFSALMLWNITNAFFRIFWGFLLDHFGFKNIYLIILFLQIFTFSLFYFVAKSQFLFFLFNFFSAVAISGTTVTIPFSFEESFGITNGAICFGISHFISAVASFGVPYLIERLKEKAIHFLILFLSNSVSSMMAIIVLCFIEEKKYDYNKHVKEDRLSFTSITSTI